jgi:hypothetical protein
MPGSPPVPGSYRESSSIFPNSWTTGQSTLFSQDSADLRSRAGGDRARIRGGPQGGFAHKSMWLARRASPTRSANRMARRDTGTPFGPAPVVVLLPDSDTVWSALRARSLSGSGAPVAPARPTSSGKLPPAGT